MASGKLIFLRPASGSAKLVLGDAHAAAATPDSHIAIDADFAQDLPASVVLAVGVGLRVDAVFDADMPCAVALAWDANVQRGGIRHAVSSHWQQARPTASAAVQAPWQQAKALRIATATQWQAGQRSASAVQAPWQQAKPLRHATQQHWQDGQKLRHATRQHWQEATRLRAAVATVWQQGELLRHAVRLHYQEATRLRASTHQRWQEGIGRRASTHPAWGHGVPVAVHLRSHWQDAMRPLAGVSPASTKPPKPPQPICYDPARLGLLVVDTPAPTGWKLLFVCYRVAPPKQAIVVTPRRAYIVLNNITLHRLDTGAPLHAHGFSMSLDYQSWTWQWSASLHHNAADHLGRDANGDPPVLVAEINGQPFRLRLEKLSRDRRFNPTRWAVSGRGLAATLAAPWAVKTSFGNTLERTAHQLMQDVLTVNGVPLGWSLDWQLQDWMVPAGAWAMQGSYIEAITDIAGAVGGYVQPHATDAVLRILPKYPHAPWNWPTLLMPDFDLPKEVGEVEGTEYLDKPAYNGVFVGGQGMGVFGPVTRAGTAGDVLAPQVLHPLITDATAHSQRGMAELADTGTQEHVTLTMQVLPETGVITPGKAVLYRGHDRDYLGIVRATSINWASPKLRQTITLETHP